MKPTNLLLVFSLILSSLSGFSQAKKLYIETDRQEDKTVDFSYKKSVPGTYTVLINFTKLDNSIYSRRALNLSNYSGRLFTLKPTRPESHISMSFSYTYFLGEVDPKLDLDFNYVLPVSKEKVVKVEKLFNVDDRYFNEDKPKNWTAFLIKNSKQDTVKAMRKGVVVRIENKHNISTSSSRSFTTDTNTILIEHKDGSFSRYGAFEKDKIFVKLGQTVYPHTKLGLTTEYNQGEYRLYFSIFYKTEGTDDQGKKKYVWAYINPYFETSQGKTQLVSRSTYSSAMSETTYLTEFSRREKKQLKKDPSKFE